MATPTAHGSSWPVIESEPQLRPMPQQQCRIQCLQLDFFLASPTAYGVPGSQGSDLNYSCDLSHSCCNTRFLTHCPGRGSNQHPSAPKMTLIPLHHSRNSCSQILFFFFLMFFVKLIYFAVQSKQKFFSPFIFFFFNFLYIYIFFLLYSMVT